MKNYLCVTAFAVALMLSSSAAFAQTNATPSNPAAATTSGSNGQGGHTGPCHADVQKFCSTVPKGNGRILDCLKEHVGQLSPRCEAAMKRHANDKPGSSATGGTTTGK